LRVTVAAGRKPSGGELPSLDRRARAHPLHNCEKCSSSPACADDKTLENKLERLAQPYIDAERVVGISIGVLKAGQATTAHVGRTRTKGKRPDDDTVYEIGSVSKVFTGILVADAVVRGRVRLDQPVQELLPEDVKMPAWQDRPITIADLATHRSGLPKISSNMPVLKTDNPYADYTSKLAYEFLTEHKLRRPPGAKYEYSNFGMALVGHLISENAELRYDDLLQQRIAEPLGMKSTRVGLSPSMMQRLATPHSAVGEETSTWEFADMPGAGGIRSSTKDMLRFVRAQLSPPDDEIGRAIELALKKHTDDDSKGPAMGLGWSIAGDGITRLHNGQTGGFHSMLGVNRKEETAIFCSLTQRLLNSTVWCSTWCGCLAAPTLNLASLKKRFVLRRKSWSVTSVSINWLPRLCLPFPSKTTN
jgi:CubicO group peptidase (beta-lactamase class C family)